MSREDVFAAINSEREFQEMLTADPSRPDMIEDLHVGDTITAIQYNLNKAMGVWYIGSNPHPEAMKYLRKIAALCVQMGEKHGMPSR